MYQVRKLYYFIKHLGMLWSRSKYCSLFDAILYLFLILLSRFLFIFLHCSMWILMPCLCVSVYNPLLCFSLILALCFRSYVTSEAVTSEGNKLHSTKVKFLHLFRINIVKGTYSHRDRHYFCICKSGSGECNRHVLYGFNVQRYSSVIIIPCIMFIVNESQGLVKTLVLMV